MYVDIVNLLIDNNAQIDIANTDGWTALMLASNEGNTDVVNLLLDNNVQTDTINVELHTALIIASGNGHKDVVKLLVRSKINNLEDIPQNDPLQKEPLDKKEQEHLTAIENAIQDRGQLDHTLVHGVFVGPPRSGKDSLMKHLLGEKITDTSPSTEVAENVVHVKIEESFTFAASIEQSNWTRLAYDEEAVHLMKIK